jgi:hypothetical protein
MARHQALELGHHLSVPAERKVSLDPGLEGIQPQLLQAHGCRAGKVLLNTGQRGPSPQGQGLGEDAGGPFGIAVEVPAAFGEEPLEAEGIHLLGVNFESVAGGPSDQQAGRVAAFPRRLEDAPQARHGAVHDGGGGRRGPLPPQQVDQPLDRQPAAGVKDESGEQSILAGRAERDHTAVVVHDFQGAEEPKLHAATPLKPPAVGSSHQTPMVMGTARALAGAGQALSQHLAMRCPNASEDGRSTIPAHAGPESGRRLRPLPPLPDPGYVRCMVLPWDRLLSIG